MEQILVNLPPQEEQCSYKILIGNGILETFGITFPCDSYSKIMIVVDKNAASHVTMLLKNLPRKTLVETVSGDEKIKSFSGIEKLWDAFLRHGLDRSSLVITLGGGALCDATGFAASTFKRGVSFLHIPTTLLAQVDASVGGKTGFNFGSAKNIIGTIKQPIGVVIDTDTLKTLPKRELISGFAEIIKHGAILDAPYFESIESFHQQERSLVPLIHRSCELKAGIVAQDPYEKGVRKLLNFGHTLGHAFEALSHERGVPLLHGEAISIGMRGEAVLAEKVFKNTSLVERLTACLIKYNLPIKLPFSCTLSEIQSLISQDKKNVGTSIRWSLPSDIGIGRFDVEGAEQYLAEALLVIT